MVKKIRNHVNVVCERPLTQYYEFAMHVTHELMLYDLWESARLISTLTKILGVICHITGSWLTTQMALCSI